MSQERKGRTSGKEKRKVSVRKKIPTPLTGGEKKKRQSPNDGRGKEEGCPQNQASPETCEHQKGTLSKKNRKTRTREKKALFRAKEKKE